MTAASEAYLCAEIGLRYNSLAIIDNFANGIEGPDIDFDSFRDLVKANRRRWTGSLSACSRSWQATDIIVEKPAGKVRQQFVIQAAQKGQGAGMIRRQGRRPADKFAAGVFVRL